ncbi:MAG: hypothetical protein FJ386_00755 [Verrucomicrobia bacterium]|nr:hypothetical protein [Verrucomicrobiota bacterium]
MDSWPPSGRRRPRAPRFVTHEVTTADGQTHSGLLESSSPDGTVTLLTADGKGLVIPGPQVKSRTQSRLALMPEGLEQGMTVQDFRDVISFLLSRK